jgi:dihydropyrimidinase
MSDLELIIKGGNIVTTTETYVADIGVQGEKIVAIAKNLRAASGTRIINAAGKYVFPGAIDVHVHFQLPAFGTVSCDDFESGTKAAACGGVTTVLDFAIQKKGRPIMEAVQARRAEADGKVYIDYGLHAGITDWNPQTQAEVKRVIEAGIPSFKMFMIYKSEGWMADDAMLFSALEETAKRGAMITVHAESAAVLDLLIERYAKEKERWGAYAHTLSRPCFIEEEAVMRAVKWAEATGGQLYVVHMSTGEAAAVVHASKQRKARVYAETCPQYLLLNDEVFKRPDGHLFATCPQVKKPHDNEQLWRAAADGTVQVVATDTCPFTTQQKAAWNGDFRKIPFGLPGVETLLPLMYSEGVGKRRLSVKQLVALVSTNPAKLFGLYPQKGAIAGGSDADLVIFDPTRKLTLRAANLQSKCDWSPYEDWKLVGYPIMTIARGAIVVEEGKPVGEGRRGRFLQRKPGGAL